MVGCNLVICDQIRIRLHIDVAWVGMSTRWRCPTCIFFCRQRRRPISKVAWRMVLETVMTYDMIEPYKFPSPDSCRTGSWSCSTPSRWSCAPSRRCGEVSLGTSLWKPESFFLFVQSQQAGSMFHSHRGGWRRQENCTVYGQRTKYV